MKPCLEKTIIFLICVVAFLMLSSIVNHSFAISLVGFGLSLIWFFVAYTKGSSLHYNTSIFSFRIFKYILIVWLTCITISVAAWAYARFVCPGYDLYWFTQAVSNAKLGHGLMTSSERIYPSTLAQHWEPILYTAIPFVVFQNGCVGMVLWQVTGLCLGTIGAWKLCSLIFKKTEYTVFSYLLTIFYTICFANINPLMFDVHPPVFGVLLFIPWILFCILSERKKTACVLIFLLMQCGEIFFAVGPAYFALLILHKHHTSIWRWCVCGLLYFSGFLLLGVYQRYIGPWWTGLPFHYASRYASIGGDGMGILHTAITHPWLVISQIFVVEKIKTFAKLFVYYGFLPVIAVFSKKYRMSVVWVWLGTIPYFIQVGLSSDTNMYSTNTHYIASLGSQWWLLTVFGVSALTQNQMLRHPRVGFRHPRVGFRHPRVGEEPGLLFVILFISLYFLNASEWRRSPVRLLTSWINLEPVNSETRHYLKQLPQNAGIYFTLSTEFLCPIAADNHFFVLCVSGTESFLPRMPLHVVVSSVEDLQKAYNDLPKVVQNSPNGVILNSIGHNLLKKIHWHIVAQRSQISTKKNPPRVYTIWAQDGLSAPSLF